MNKQEFINKVADSAGLSKKDSKAAVDAVLETITEAVASGDSVSFVGFGTFSQTARAARTAIVPGTNKTVDVPATKAVKFKVGKAFKEAVKG